LYTGRGKHAKKKSFVKSYTQNKFLKINHQGTKNTEFFNRGWTRIGRARSPLRADFLELNWATTQTCKPVENNYSRRMAKKAAGKPSVAADVSPRQAPPEKSAALSRAQPRPSSLLDTRVVYCGDNLEQLAKRSHKVIVAPSEGDSQRDCSEDAALERSFELFWVEGYKDFSPDGLSQLNSCLFVKFASKKSVFHLWQNESAQSTDATTCTLTQKRYSQHRYTWRWRLCFIW